MTPSEHPREQEERRRVCDWCGLTNDVQPVPSRGPVPRQACIDCRREEGLETAPRKRVRRWTIWTYPQEVHGPPIDRDGEQVVPLSDVERLVGVAENVVAYSERVNVAEAPRPFLSAIRMLSSELSRWRAK